MKKPARSAAVAALVLFATSSAAAAQNAAAQTASSQRAAASAGKVGTLVIAHGGGPVWDGHVLSVAKNAKTGGPVEVSFLMGPGAKTARFQDAAAKLVAAGATEIVVVPVLVSSHSGHYEQIRYLAGATDSIDDVMMHHLHMGGIERASVNVPIRVARALDNAPEMAQVLADRVRSQSQDDVGALFLIGHGSNSAEDHAQWMRNLRPVADSVKKLTGFGSVLVGLVRDDAPADVRAEAVKTIRETILLQAEATGKKVLVVPILISKGSVSDQKIPADLEGLPIYYTPTPLLPHDAMARWIERSVAGAATVTAQVSRNQ